MAEKKKKIGRNKSGQFTSRNTFSNGGTASSKYRSEYIQKMIKFFDIPPTRTETVDNKPVIIPCDYPTFEGFARTIGVTLGTLEKWVEKNKSFKTAYERCKDIQKNILIVNAIGGRYSPSFSKFVAMNHHGMSEKVEEKLQLDKGYDINISIDDGKGGENEEKS